MEKLHKYCLSVLLVIICSNISAQSNSCSVENDTYNRLYEVYSQFLNSQHYKESHFSERKNKIHYNAINQKQNAGDLIEITSNKYNDPGLYKLGHLFENEKYNQVLENFERINKAYRLAGAFYFKSKVSKIRNKDYLDVIS